MKKKIELIVLDIDGVLTDGKVIIDCRGREYKAINYRDLDNIRYLKDEGFDFALLTGEDTDFVDVIAERLKIKDVIRGAKDKAASLRRLSKNKGIPLEGICYVGDADRDADGMRIVGMSFAPKDATKKAKAAASHVLSLRGGEGVVGELIGYLPKKGYE